MAWNKFLNPKNILRKFFFFKPTLQRLQGVVAYYNVPVERKELFEMAQRVSRETELLLEPQEAYQLATMVRRLAKVPGDIAEVGVYRGGSAKIMMEADPQKTVHLFDTFEGLPEPTEKDFPEHSFTAGEYRASFEGVQQYLKDYRQANFYRGLFPATAAPVAEKRFSFVHLDVDLYQPTRDALGFFYPRLQSGGVIVSHDYIKPGGVRKAVDEFFQNKPEAVFDLSGTQCMIVKL